MWPGRGDEGPGPERSAGVVGNWAHRHAEGLRRLGAAGTRAAQARSPQWTSIRVSRPPRQPDQGALARWTGHVPVREAPRARSLHLAIVGEWDNCGDAGAARLSARRHRLASAAASVATASSGLSATL